MILRKPKHSSFYDNPKTADTPINRRNLSKWQVFKLWFLTLFYHTSISYEYAFDTIMEPVFWFVDHFTHLLGPAFVVVVVVLVAAVAGIAHFLGLPFWLEKSPAFTSFLIIVGYWILTNLAFNFYKIATVPPGTPTDPDKLLKCNVTICKKCVSPKPQRTHHCSICNKCYLSMDHHCPWVNNCVGHFNRRYFFLTMVFIVIGCCFIMLFGVELAFREIILHEHILPDCRNLSQLEMNILHSLSKNPADYSDWVDLLEKCDDQRALLWLGVTVQRQTFRYLVFFAGLLCIGTSLALGGLSLWHAKLITSGETSIEYHINKTERKKDHMYVNVYDLGKRRNWEVLLGLDQPDVSFFRHILFPSSHLPTGDGYDWRYITNEGEEWRRRWGKEGGVAD